MRLAPLAMLLVACGRGDVKTVDSLAAGADSTASAVVSSTGDGLRTTGDGVAPCRPTGEWSACHVFDRLDRAGLAPRRDSTIATEPPLTPTGAQLLVGSATLELYLYPDVRTREREQGKLDRSKYVSFDAPLMGGAQFTLISNTNLIAILHSRNDHLRERVADAITAGPPQPPSSQPPPTP
jgi:hypothetical protein